jgi:hypothetical protein
MNKWLVFFLSVSTYSILNSAEVSPIIPNASYYVFDGDNNRNVHSRWSTAASIYTFDGVFLEKRNATTLEICARFQDLLDSSLDPQAPKPQSTKYKIVYWSAFDTKYYKTQENPGNFLVFFDRRGNIITSVRYEGPDSATIEDVSSYPMINHSGELVASAQVLDLSIVEKCKASEMQHIDAYNDRREKKADAGYCTIQ